MKEDQLPKVREGCFQSAGHSSRIRAHDPRPWGRGCQPVSYKALEGTESRQLRGKLREELQRQAVR